ncbi:uncharacterized protein LOC120353220 isoform X2 [Nilaparvata lugens]|uniref:uncharacterized protein LOC120353220 isoform X1 n=1 Tax=Nilaparvata lugens TaxID=108931 RepID=UPI00193CD6D9|nr:uncharacterized protein LOC120353220 isoform X1 [Nilaparvata lugens]XP_039291987.1 uncharacterized protein LOC120353220 isoform X2 [Nilaparvata lugens]
MEVMNFEEVNDCTTRIKDEVVIVTDTKENEDIFQDFKMEVPGDVVEVMNFEEVNHCTTRIKDEVVVETDNKENVDCFQDFKVEVPGDVMRDLELEGVNECMRKEDKNEDMMHNEDNLSFSNECRKEVTEEVIYLGENTIKLENNSDSSTGTLMNNPKDIFDDFENNVYNAVSNGEVNRHSRDFKKNEYNVSINCDNSNLSEVSSIEISSTTMTVEDNRNKMIDCEQNTAKSTDVIYKKTTIINHDENANHSIVYKTGECDNNTPILSETNYINPSNDAKYSIVLVRLVPVLEKSLDKKCENDVNYCIEQSKIIPGVVKWKPFDKNLITGDNSLLNIVKNGANNSTIQNSVRKQDINSTVVTKSVRQKTDKNSRKKEVKKFKGDPMRTYTSNKAQSYEKSEQSICDVGIKEDKKECRVLKEDYNYLISKDKVVEGSMQVEGGSNGLRYGQGGIGEASNRLGIRQGGIGEASNRLGIRQGGIGEASNRLVNRQGGIGLASNQQGTIQGVMGEASNKLGVGLGEIEASNRLREGQVFIREASNGLGIQQIKEEASNRLRKSQISMREALNGLGIHEVNKGASNESWEKQGVTEEPSNVLGIGQGVFSDGLGIQQVKEDPLNGLGIGQGVASIGLEEAIKGLSETVLQDTNYIENDSGFSSLEALCNVAASAAKYLKWDSVRSKRSPKKKNQCLNEIRFYCKTCNRSYPSSRDFRKHRCSLSSVNNRWAGIIESGGLFTCEECKRNFRSKNGYLIHRRSHTGERPYACRWCEKAFGDSGTRHKHERIHTGERPFQCEQCPRAFNQRAALRAHQITHSSCLTRSFTCKLCPSSFSYFANLRRHVIVCHREYTAIPCPLCTLPKTLHYDNTALVQHVKSVHWEDGTKCLICDQKQFDDVNEYCSHVISHVKRARNAGGVRLNNNFIKQEGDVSLV